MYLSCKKNVKMSTIVGILTIMSRINFVLSCVEHEKQNYPGPDLLDKIIKDVWKILTAYSVPRQLVACILSAMLKMS